MVKNKNTKVVLLLIVVLSIFILISYLATIFLDSTSRKMDYIYDDEIYDWKLIYPSHTYIISNNYEGELSLKTINKSINYFCSTYIVELLNRFNKSSTDESIKEYYNKNKTNIAIISGITQYEDFYKLVKSICNINSTELILKRIEIEPDSVDWEGIDFICDINLYYENNLELHIQLTIADERYSKKISPIKFTIID